MLALLLSWRGLVLCRQRAHAFPVHVSTRRGRRVGLGAEPSWVSFEPRLLGKSQILWPSHSEAMRNVFRETACQIPPAQVFPCSTRGYDNLDKLV